MMDDEHQLQLSKIFPFTCFCFFGSGVTDFETLLTSLWTSVKIWFRFSTFSFFTALICEATNYTTAGAANTAYKGGFKLYVMERKNEIIEKRSYVFECCRDRFCFVLVLQVFVCHLKDILLFFPFLLILRHVLPGEKTPISMGKI